jgi:hypothetical protein
MSFNFCIGIPVILSKSDINTTVISWQSEETPISLWILRFSVDFQQQMIESYLPVLLPSQNLPSPYLYDFVCRHCSDFSQENFLNAI